MNANHNTRRSKPLVLKQGSVSVKIYTHKTRTAGREYDQFTLSYYSGNRRVRATFSEFEEAKSEANLALVKLANGDNDALRLTGADRAIYVQSTQVLKPFNLALNVAVNDYAAALGRLPKGTTLRDAVEYFATRHPSNAPEMMVAAVVQEFIADRRAGGCSAHHLRDLGIRMGRFGRDFAMPISQVHAPMVRAYIQSLLNRKTGRPAMNRSKENTLRMIKTLFTFARKQRHIARELADEIGEIEAPKSEPSRIGIYTPEEMARMLAAADAEIVPAFAIAAFTGLRLAEVSRLDWRDVRLAEACIIVEAAKAKTAARRIAPIPENLAAWIAPYAHPDGVLNPAPDDNALGNRFERIARRAKVPWQRNGLRHSFISYRVALTKNVNQTALEAGNSAAIVFRNYREVVREEDAKRWFGIMPEGEPNVMAMPSAVAA